MMPPAAPRGFALVHVLWHVVTAGQHRVGNPQKTIGLAFRERKRLESAWPEAGPHTIEVEYVYRKLTKAYDRGAK